MKISAQNSEITRHKTESIAEEARQGDETAIRMINKMKKQEDSDDLFSGSFTRGASTS